MIKIIGKWGGLKWMRFIMAALIFGYGVFNKDWLMVLAGIFLLYMVVFNKGCIGGSCEILKKNVGEKD